MRTLSSPQTSKIRILALIAVAVLFVLFLSANGVASFYTDWLWFDNMELGGIWTTILGTKIFLAAVFTLIFFAVLWGNLYLADRLKPDTRPESPEEDLVERYHAAVGAQAGKVRFGVAALFGLIAGANTSSQWQTWLLFRNGGDFGRTDELFGEDAGFYVFRLPFWTFLVDWFFAALVLTLIVVLVAHYLNGGIRAVATQDRVSSGVKLHISILLAVLALLRAAAYWIDRYHLVTSTRGTYDGALATDVNIQLPALNLLALISLFSAVLFVANIRRPGWGLPVVAIGIWLVSHFVIGGIFPLVYQRVRVQPVESQREAEFVERNIAATRFAYGLDSESVTTRQFDYQPRLTAADVDSFEDVLANVPVVDPQLATEEVTRTEAARKIYGFSSSLDVDRYEIDGEQRPVVLSVRGLNVGEVGASWEQQHIIFTHGHGLAMAAAYDETARVSGESRNLDFLVSGLGESVISDGLDLTLDQPRIYFGEGLDGYAIVGAARNEVDFQTSDNQSIDYRYTGEGGVPMGSIIRRAAFSLRFREPDPLISRNVTDESKVIYNRDIRDRVREIAPFLRFDNNPYPVVIDDGLFWVMDGYTTTSDFPYSQSVITNVGGDLAGGYNYVRNSVKVVVDAYNGDVAMYVIDEEDPLIQAWRAVFPELFSDDGEMPSVLRDHLRYPEDIFTVQTDMWTNYVVDDATQFIEGALAWSIASQPRIEAQTNEGDAAPAGSMSPQYLMAQLPDNDQTEFVLQRAFVPRGGSAGTSTDRPELTGIMMARSDPEHYGELVMVRLPGGQVNAPNLVHSEIRKNFEVTEFIRDKAGARVQFGEMSIVLVADTIVFVRPVYVEANSATAVPELQRVVAVNGPRIFMGRSIEEAIAGVVDGAPGSDPTIGGESNGQSGSSDGASGQAGSYNPTGRSLLQLLADAEESLAKAAEAAANDAPESAAAFQADAQAALLAAQELLQGPPSTTIPPTTQPPAEVEEAAESTTEETVATG
ncbi:MAG: UPF0182 family protein [Acidimicrobiales bacterium]